MRLVVDASVAVKWFLRTRANEQHLAAAETVAHVISLSGTELFAPDHWAAEVVAVLARNDPGIVDDAILVLDDMRPRAVRGVPLLKRAADLTIKFNHHLFDTLYHAVALETGATLVTTDDRYFAKARSEGSILMLRDFQAAP